MKSMRKRILLILAATAALILLDQVAKYLAANYPCACALFEYSENTGIAFGIPVPPVLLIILTAALIVAIVYFAKNELNLRSPITQTAFALILAGGIGNLIDRLFRGYVIDFISIWIWPNFNFADVYIVVGVLLILTFYAKVKKV